MAWKHVNREDASEDRVFRCGVHFSVQREASGGGEARVVERRARDFDKIAVLGEDPAVRRGRKGMNGEDFEDVPRLDLDGFLRRVVLELRGDGGRTEAGGSEGDGEEPAAVWMARHRSAELRDEQDDGLREEDDEKADGGVHHPLLRSPGRLFIAETEDEHDAANDDGDGGEEPEHVDDSVESPLDGGPQISLRNALDALGSLYSLLEAATAEDLRGESGRGKEERGRQAEESGHGRKRENRSL